MLVALRPVGFVKYFFSVSIVILSADCALAKSLSRLIKSLRLYFLSIATISSTPIVLSVIVPVLSTHKTLTRASVSILFMSWRSTFFCANFIALTANAMLASRKSPSGIMPTTDATAAWTLRWRSTCLRKKFCTNIIKPIGIIAIPASVTILLIERIISDCSLVFVFFACRVSLEM